MQARGLTRQVDQLQVVGQCHGFGVGDAQAVGQGGGVVCGTSHIFCNLQEEKEKTPNITLGSQASLLASQGQRLVSISKQPVSIALFAVWLQPYPFLVMPFSKESLFFFVFPSLNPHLACYLFSPGKWVLLDGPAAESDTALADGSLEQALVLWAQRLWCKTETRGFQGQTCEEPIT